MLPQLSFFFFIVTSIVYAGIQPDLSPWDHRGEERMELGEVRGDTGAVRYVLIPSVRKTSIITPQKNKAFSQEMHLKIALLWV
jgi:hypothetical protein